MWISGQFFNQDIVSRIRATIQEEPSLSRYALSRRICEWLDWRAPNGHWKDMSCRKALIQLDLRGVIHLPKNPKTYPFQRTASPPPYAIPEEKEIRGSLSDLGPIEIIPIEDRTSPEAKIWKALMERYHYLGAGPLCGAQMRYLARSRDGWVGAWSYSGATWRLKDRETWIGWSESARRAHLPLVLNHSRFLILPTVHVPHLASHLLSQGARRVVEDWKTRYNYAPVLLETFVDPRRFAGTSYAAANWQRIGSTAGRTDGYPNGRVSDGK